MYTRSLAMLLMGVLVCFSYPTEIYAQANTTRVQQEIKIEIQQLQEKIAALRIQLEHAYRTPTAQLMAVSTKASQEAAVREVPFYSQFTDISNVSWQKVSCGIAAIAMLIDYYSDETIVPDQLLEKGIARRAFLSDAGWIHSGLIGLSRDYGLDGETKSLSHLSRAAALTELTKELQVGPVMASVHYTFEPTNPIPHLVVVNAIKNGLVYYNDPAEASGGGTLAVEKFQRAWKQRYITVRPS